MRSTEKTGLVVGVDTHRDTHTAAICDPADRPAIRGISRSLTRQVSLTVTCVVARAACPVLHLLSSRSQRSENEPARRARLYCCQVRSICLPVLASRNSHSVQLLGAGTGAGELELPGSGAGGITGPHCFELNPHVSSSSAV
jgi:hypothetical protein